MNNVSVTVDTRNLVKAQAILQQFSRTDMAQGLNRTAYFVVRAAQRNTPFVSISRIDADLNALSTPIIGKRGKKAGKPTGRLNVKVAEGGGATMIVLARMKRGSYYNRKTDHKYYINRETFSPGGGAQAFWKKVEQVATRMVKIRHSSTHWFQASWNLLLDKIRPGMPTGYRGGAGLKTMKVTESMGAVALAATGSSVATVTVENMLGMSGQYPQMDLDRNRAAHRIMGPALQKAIDSEAISKFDEAIKRSLAAKRPALSSLGVTIA